MNYETISDVWARMVATYGQEFLDWMKKNKPEVYKRWESDK